MSVADDKTRRFRVLFDKKVASGVSPNEAAALALGELKDDEALADQMDAEMAEDAPPTAKTADANAMEVDARPDENPALARFTIVRTAPRWPSASLSFSCADGGEFSVERRCGLLAGDPQRRALVASPRRSQGGRDFFGRLASLKNGRAGFAFVTRGWPQELSRPCATVPAHSWPSCGA